MADSGKPIGIISIHALRKESDPSRTGLTQFLHLFQSTLSVRRATSPTGVLVVGLDISIHALRKESDDRKTKSPKTARISIHALRKESDRKERQDR